VHTRFPVLWLLVFGAAACSSGSGPGGAPGALYRSGTRLRARVTDAGDGARRFDGWYDTQLETPCTFLLAADGVQRCLPTAGIVVGPPYYLDAACSVPVTDYVDPNAEAPFLATAGPLVPGAPAGCGADLLATAAYDQYLVDAWRVGAEQPNAGALFFRDDAGACNQSRVSSGPVHPLEPIAAAQLVEATMTVEARGASMAVEIVTGDDGSKAVGQMFNTTLGRPCFPSWVYGIIDDYRCYSGTAQAATGSGIPQECGTSTVAVAACADEIFLDGSICRPSFHRLASTPCGSSSVAGRQFYELGAPFDPARFPSLTSDLVGNGRLRLVITHPSDDGRPLFVNPFFFGAQDRYAPGPFFDTDRQLPCGDATFEDGTIRCLTSDALQDPTYSDPACTNPIAAQPTYPQICATATPPPPQLAFRNPGRLYTLGSLVARTEVYSLNGSTVPATCDQSSTAGMYYDLVPADPGTLAPLTRVTE
jgi:hypothetical protein